MVKIKRGTTYNETILPFIHEKMNSWLPPNIQAMTLWPIFAGESKYEKNYWVNHDYFENVDIQIVMKGNLKISYQNTVIILEQGKMCFIPFSPHKLETGPAGFCLKKSIGFSGMALKILIKTLGLDSFFILDEFWSPKTMNIYNKICDLLNRKNQDDVSELSILAYSFLMEISEKRLNIQLPEVLIRCRHFIEQNIFQRITLADLCAVANCSKTTLTYLFKKHMNVTPIQFMINLKISYAKNLLQDKSIQIKEVAILCGYQNQLYFSNDFRKHTGYSPKQFKSLAKQEDFGDAADKKALTKILAGCEKNR